MAEFYYQIKGRMPGKHGSYSEWAWPPVFSGMVEAEGRKEAKLKIEEEYGRQFPLRVLRKDMDEHDYLLHIRELTPTDDYLRRRFHYTPCKECGTEFRLIDKYNDHPNTEHGGSDYCSEQCRSAGRQRELLDFNLATEGRLPAVIYQVRQKATGKVYIGQTIQAFTLRWWQHLTTPSDCKFHEALKSSPITDWEFCVVEVVEYPPGCKNKVAYLADRERFWIEKFNSVVDGFNTTLPSRISPQETLDLEAAAF
ncbi:TPA: GIY-YIG nuclease family protein [Pseudomonas aeruginosa]|nr:GIY-YIG nuclease family protein [Pseudomonas aeruginosa]HBP1602111.1 GIY-YIG nuclease family protein [Pseudomonas aeruginosa]